MSTPPRLLRLPDVIWLTGLGRDSIYRLGNAGQFPKPLKIGDRASAWREDEIQKWIETRPTFSAPVPQPAKPKRAAKRAKKSRSQPAA